MVKICYAYAVKAFDYNMYIGKYEDILFTEDIQSARCYPGNIALKVAENAEKLFGIKFCIEMVRKEFH